MFDCWQLSSLTPNLSSCVSHLGKWITKHGWLLLRHQQAGGSSQASPWLNEGNVIWAPSHNHRSYLWELTYKKHFKHLLLHGKCYEVLVIMLLWLLSLLMVLSLEKRTKRPSPTQTQNCGFYFNPVPFLERSQSDLPSQPPVFPKDFPYIKFVWLLILLVDKKLLNLLDTRA